MSWFNLNRKSKLMVRMPTDETIEYKDIDKDETEEELNEKLIFNEEYVDYDDDADFNEYDEY